MARGEIRFRSYKPDRRGLAKLQNSPRLGAATLALAARGAQLANQADPEGNYTASPRTVAAGWRLERRAGAVISQTSPSWIAERDRTLVQISRALRSR
ncbi:hypothetical protein [Nesterenkonia sp. K-15-9-6]|uniref:hypothetical protein n=1 Tax=Nesterenkonia sp. K-15-9-6 TaxID=3093918 RepID=UPI0040443878